MKILVTGAAGFIGFHLTKRFLEQGDDVIGLDNLNEYYDVNLKKARLAELGISDTEALRATSDEARATRHGRFAFMKLDITDCAAVEKLFSESEFDLVLHMAAQAGVRYSLENPHAYIQANIVGFMNILEGCRSQLKAQSSKVRAQSSKLKAERKGFPLELSPLSFHLLYASSSSVYGSNTKLPFSVGDRTDRPVSLYAATKKSNELMAHAYSHLYGIPAVGLRFFTAYGPWGRPDMALFKFTRAILNDEPIDVYGNGNMRRDFTYIDDVVEAIVRIADRMPVAAPNSELRTPSCIYNIGNSSPVNLMDFIRAIEDATGRAAKINYLPMQPGDVKETFADIDELKRDVDFAPRTPIAEGVGKFVEWYKDYYR